MTEIIKIKAPVRESTKINGVIYTCIETEDILSEIVDYFKFRSKKVILIRNIYQIDSYSQRELNKLFIQNNIFNRIHDLFTISIMNHRTESDLNYNYKDTIKDLKKRINGVGLVIFDYDQHYFGVTRRMNKMHGGKKHARRIKVVIRSIQAVM